MMKLWFQIKAHFINMQIIHTMKEKLNVVNKNIGSENVCKFVIKKMDQAGYMRVIILMV